MSALSITAAIRPFPLAMHFYSFVSQMISLFSSSRLGACNDGVHLFPLAMQHFYSFVSNMISSKLSKSVRLAAGQRVRLPSGLSPFVSLLVGHCVRLVSLLFPFSPTCSGRMISSLSPGLCSWPHDFTFVSQLSVLWPHDFILVSHLFPICLPVSSRCSQCLAA